MLQFLSNIAQFVAAAEGRASRAQVEAALKKMQDDGVVYSTMTDQHYKSVMCPL